jgi:hypothetical protein
MLQIPKQDLALAYCKHVESQHHSSYDDFINARNEIALDIGYVKDNNSFSSVSSAVYTQTLLYFRMRLFVVSYKRTDASEEVGGTPRLFSERLFFKPEAGWYVFRGFSKSLLENAGTVPHIGPNPHPFTFLPVHWYSSYHIV